MRTRAVLLFLIYLIPDLAAIVLSLVISASYSISTYVIAGSTYTLAGLNLTYIGVLLCVVWYFSSKSTGLYDDLAVRPYSVEAFYILKNIIVQFLFLVLILFSMKEPLLTRTFVLSYTLILALALLTEKLVMRFVITRFTRRMHAMGNVLIIGANEMGHTLYTKLTQPPLAHNVVGFIDDDTSGSYNNVRIDSLDRLAERIEECAVTMVIIALPRHKLEYVDDIIAICQDHLVEVKIIPDLAHYRLRGYGHSFLGDIPVVSVDVDRLSETYWRFAKRLTDVVLTLILTLFIFCWLFPLVILLQKLFNPGTIFYKSERWGKGGKPFQIYKFRTMTVRVRQQSTEEKSFPTEHGDDRVTKFGRILRRTSIDELPQFLNVLKGEMSIVGPRPLEAEEAAQMKQILSNYMVRHYVLPGITGWAQINGYRGGTRDVTLMQKRIDLDNWYINNWTLGLDFQIILMTTFKLFFRDSNAY